MGQDKALMAGGVERLMAAAQSSGVDHIITLCGSIERVPLFKGKVWPDPEACNSLMEVIYWALDAIEGAVQLIPCDAFQLEHTGSYGVNCIDWRGSFGFKRGAAATACELPRRMEACSQGQKHPSNVCRFAKPEPWRDDKRDEKFQFARCSF